MSISPLMENLYKRKTAEPLAPIIESLLENDAYKFSMGQAIYHQFSDYKTT